MYLVLSMLFQSHAVGDRLRTGLDAEVNLKELYGNFFVAGFEQDWTQKST
jgi:hypothetical protein